jgi:hypothetical protein
VKLSYGFLSAEREVLLGDVVVSTSLQLFPFFSPVGFYSAAFEFRCLLKNDGRDVRRLTICPFWISSPEQDGGEGWRAEMGGVLL